MTKCHCSRQFVGPAWLRQAAGSGSVPQAPHPVPHQAQGGHRASGPFPGSRGPEGVAAQKASRDPPAGSHQRSVGQKSPQQEEKRRKFQRRFSRSPNTCCISMCWLFLLRGLSVGDTLSVYLMQSQYKVLHRATLRSRLHKFCHFKLSRSNEVTFASQCF